MKKRICVILIFPLIIFYFNSCASTPKAADENVPLAEEKTIEKVEEVLPDADAEKTLAVSENEDNKENIEIAQNSQNEKSPIEAPPISPIVPSDEVNSTDSQETAKDSVEQSSLSVPDPKPIADEPEVELMLHEADEIELLIEDETLSLDENPAKDAPLNNALPDNKVISEDKEPQLSEAQLVKPDMFQDQPIFSNANEGDFDNQGYFEKQDIDDVVDTNQDAPFSQELEEEDASVFSEFPSTEPDDSAEERASRSVKLYTGQRLEVLYPGEGWVYLGESTAQKGIKYQQRKLQNGTTVFHFGAIEDGDYILHFSHFDVFSDNFISDSLAVHIEKAKTKIGDTVRAPDYIGTVNTEKGAGTESKKGSINEKKGEGEHKKDSDISKNTAGSPLKNDAQSEKKEAAGSNVYDSPDLLTVTDKPKPEKEKPNAKLPLEFLDKIRAYIAEGNAPEALNSIDEFFKNYSSHLDEALFLRGQAYELNGSKKNVKKAFEAYKALTKAYPDSKFWDKADARIRYIKKFYINID